MTSTPVRLSDIVQAYARRRDSVTEYEIAMTIDDRSNMVGEQEARAARARLTRAVKENQAARKQLEDLLQRAHAEALAREDVPS